jgi:(1->4)-alpha-D-glucan 1-alpha-D-glucosylmutase
MFQEATAITDYLRDLGISDFYASPILQATPETTHGYDVCRFDQLDSRLGSTGDFERFSSRLQELGLGLLLDFVPNHMAADLSNPWWRDVLEKGPASPYANWFDVDWQSADPELHGKVLLPVLEDRYARVLESGKLRVLSESGRLSLAYRDKHFPLAPESRRRARLLRPNAPAGSRGRGGRGSLEQINALVQKQHYRLASWRAGAEKINYRRFFDVPELVSLRMELPQVFRATHELIFRLVRESKVAGLRIDHPDGLWDPKEYFNLLQDVGVRVSGSAPLYVVAEKILSRDEPLPSDWPIAGTTGYDFLNQVNGLFVHPGNRAAFNRIYRAFTGDSLDFSGLAFASKQQILDTSLASERNALALRLKGIAAGSRYGQDLTLAHLQRALTAIIAAFPVYRTYVTENTESLSSVQEQYIEQAVRFVERTAAVAKPSRSSYRTTAKSRRKLQDAGEPAQAAENNLSAADVSGAPQPFLEALAFIQQLLRLQPPLDLDEAGRKSCREFVLHFQQLTGPVMAKGVEDTAFYRFNRLISLNEVGGDPEVFGVAPAAFHRDNLMKARNWPHALLATATHDTKRGEDVRARINVLSEMPKEWELVVTRWRRLNASKKTIVNGEPAPAPNDEYLLYQTLIGAWPEREVGRDVPIAPRADFRHRLAAYLLKAIKEAKTHTSWINPNPAYEEAMIQFVERLLDSSPRNRFLRDFETFQHRAAFFGRFNSLSQTLIKMTSPGVPDFYQGTELWDLNLVDPDNRRPIDFELRRRLLSELKARLGHPTPDLPALLAELLARAHTGQIKLYLIWRTLEFRRAHRELFTQGSYVPLYAKGSTSEHVCAFARLWKEQAAIIVAPRLILTLNRGAERPPIGEEPWADTTLKLPKGLVGKQWRNILTGELLTGRTLRIAQALASFPVALLSSAE